MIEGRGLPFVGAVALSASVGDLAMQRVGRCLCLVTGAAARALGDGEHVVLEGRGLPSLDGVTLGAGFR